MSLLCEIYDKRELIMLSMIYENKYEELNYIFDSVKSNLNIPSRPCNNFTLNQTFSELSKVLLNYSESSQLCISGELSTDSVLNLISWYLNFEDSLKWMEISQPGISTN